MLIFADFHHHALYHSLQLLFEKRLGGKLYRPIGTEWYHNGFWKVYDHPATVEQYLGLHQGVKIPVDVHGQPLPDYATVNKNYTVEDGIYYVNDTVYGGYHRAITLDKFKTMKFDILLSSMPSHIGPFNSLIGQFQPQAKHIFQVGNDWGHQRGVNNVLSSTAPFAVPSGINACFYHQEFPLDIFRYEPPPVNNVINSYIHYMRDIGQFTRLGQLLPGWKLTPYGAGFSQWLSTVKEVADTMINSAFTYHWKPEGDGYGHVLASTYACGRPAIVNSGQYQGKLGSRWIEDMVTCIDLNKHPIPEVARIVQSISNNPDWHNRMCQAAYDRFKSIVNFDQEEIKIRKFLDQLK